MIGVKGGFDVGVLTPTCLGDRTDGRTSVLLVVTNHPPAIAAVQAISVLTASKDVTIGRLWWPSEFGVPEMPLRECRVDGSD